jgi:hypothetical protein
MVVEFSLDRDDLWQEWVSTQWNKEVRLPMIDDPFLEKI